MEKGDEVMKESKSSGHISYRNKLLNIDGRGYDEQRREEIVILEDDYCIGRDGDVPSIDFSNSVRQLLVKGMEKTLWMIKLFGRSIRYRDLVTKTQALWQPKGSFQLTDVEGNFYFASFDLEEDYTKVLTSGPWMISGAYLTLQPWSTDFDPISTKISKVVV